MGTKIISIILLILQIIVILVMYEIPFKDYNFNLINKNDFINLFNQKRFTTLTSITNILILFYLVLFTITSYNININNMFTFLYPFIFALSLFMMTSFYLFEYPYMDNIFNKKKKTKNVIISDIHNCIIHIISPLLILLLLIYFKSNSLKHSNNLYIYIIGLFFYILFCFKLCSSLKYSGSFYYNSIDDMYKKYSNLKLNFIFCLYFLYYMFLIFIGTKVIN